MNKAAKTIKKVKAVKVTTLSEAYDVKTYQKLLYKFNETLLGTKVKVTIEEV